MSQQTKPARTIAGCTLEPWDHAQCLALLAGLEGEPGEAMPRELEWLLAHCDDGVTWGQRSPDGTWRLSTQAATELCPWPEATNLQQMRLFGSGVEVLIWRQGAELRGRELRDTAWNDEAWLRPADEQLLLAADRRIAPAASGFTLVGTGTGTRQAVPGEWSDADFKGGQWPLALGIRHYFEEDPETGAVRVAATRLVDFGKRS